MSKRRYDKIDMWKLDILETMPTERNIKSSGYRNIAAYQILGKEGKIEMKRMSSCIFGAEIVTPKTGLLEKKRR